MQSRPADDQAEHRKAEQAQVSEESREAFVLVHVADGINMHERRHAGDHGEHDERDAVDINAEVKKVRMILIDAAAEAAVALAIFLNFYNNFATIDVERATNLRG